MPRGATPGRNLGKEVATGYSGLVVDTAHGGPRRHHAADRRGSAVFVTWENEDPDCGISAGQGHYFSRSYLVGKWVSRWSRRSVKSRTRASAAQGAKAAVTARR